MERLGVEGTSQGGAAMKSASGRVREEGSGTNPRSDIETMSYTSTTPSIADWPPAKGTQAGVVRGGKKRLWNEPKISNLNNELVDEPPYPFPLRIHDGIQKKESPAGFGKRWHVGSLMGIVTALTRRRDGRHCNHRTTSLSMLFGILCWMEGNTAGTEGTHGG
jgi:hypothetical protein